MGKTKVGDIYAPQFEGMSQKDLRDNLEAIAYEEREDSYSRKLSPEEVAERRTQFANNSIKINEAKADIKDYTDKKKREIKPTENENVTLLGEIKSKTSYQKGKLYDIDDQDTGEMITCDANGVVIEVRPLTTKEKQLKIKQDNGTDR